MDHSRLDSGQERRAAGSRALTAGRRPSGRRARLAILGLLALSLALVAAGCQRKSRYRPLLEDTTAAVSSDSMAAMAKTALERWESGGGEEAARLSAAVLLADLRRHPPSEWGDRARQFLDSLSIGAESHDAPGALIVNFFSRSDPERGSWPYLFWSLNGQAKTQAVEGRDLRLADLATRPGAGGAPWLVAALYTRRSAAGSQPILFAWKPAKSGQYALAQTLGADSLGGAGSGEFGLEDTTLVLHTRTYRAARGFTECATCPHVFAIHEFRWSGSGFTRISDHQVPSPYSSFVRFVLAVQANDRDAARNEITDDALWDQARQFEWQLPRGTWRVAPSTDESAHEMTFFRGEREAYRVSFEGSSREWRLSSIAETSRNVE